MFRRISGPQFDAEQFLEETVVPLLAEQPDFARDNKLPIHYGTVPLYDFDEREQFDWQPCRIGYYLVGKSVEVGVVTLDDADSLPERLLLTKVALPNEQPFDGIVVAKFRSERVIGLRDPDTKHWHQVPSPKHVKKNAMNIIRNQVKHPQFSKQDVQA